ncbi:MAG: PP2C family protein-serine/threonine phosphatase [Candidatus Cloacimonadaceae bacterium]|jgi:serine/threonine protein phosphatase PrpC
MKDTHIDVGNLSDIGRQPGQEKNEDYFGRYDGEYGTLFIVCDGMGGDNSGEIAARIAVEAVQSYIGKYHIPTEENMIIAQAIEYAQQKLMEAVNENPAFAGMGSTLVMLMMRDNQFWYAHLGNSRLYLVRDDAITRLTRDHSEVQYLVDTGVITLEEAREHPLRGKLSKALGQNIGDPEISGPHMLYQDDVFMLCTDGLTEYVQDEELLGHLTESPQVAAHNLVDVARQRGSLDDISIQIIKILHGASMKTFEDESFEVSNRPSFEIKKYIMPALMVILLVYLLVMIPKTCKKIRGPKEVAAPEVAEQQEKQDQEAKEPAEKPVAVSAGLEKELTSKLAAKDAMSRYQDFLDRLRSQNSRLPSRVMFYNDAAQGRSVIFTSQTIYLAYNNLANVQNINAEQLEYLITLAAAMAGSKGFQNPANLGAIYASTGSALDSASLEAAKQLWISVYPDGEYDFRRIGNSLNNHTQKAGAALIVKKAASQ